LGKDAASTGGSPALQLAADGPELVSRLVVAGAAYRLSEHGREFQLRVAALSAAGDRRGLSVMPAPDVTESSLGIRGRRFFEKLTTTEAF
jgi:pimeloyl-ACP methyl ester carboxylesterase